MDRLVGTLLGQLSEFIYTPSEDKLPTIGNPSIQMHQDNLPVLSSFAGVFRYPDKTALVFKGTVIGWTVGSVVDWLANFSAALAPPLLLGLPGLVHFGFGEQLRLIHKDLLDDLNSGFAPPLYVTGHSQGVAGRQVPRVSRHRGGRDLRLRPAVPW